MIKEKLVKAYEDIRKKTDFVPELAIVLGSGLGGLADMVEIEKEISYRDIEGFPISTAPGHKGRYIFTTIADVKTVIMQGRVHMYEGYEASDVVLPIRLMGLMGARRIILTNAAGSVNRDFKIGDLMVIRDQISQFVRSPLIGENLGDLGVRFPDMSQIYGRDLSERIEEIGKRKNYPMSRGTYLQFSGPQYESPAEIRMAGLLGADAVGMSTAIEAVAARHMGMEVCGVSLISNMAAGLSDQLLSEEEVIEAGQRASSYFVDLVMEFIKELKG